MSRADELAVMVEDNCIVTLDGIARFHPALAELLALAHDGERLRDALAELLALAHDGERLREENERLDAALRSSHAARLDTIERAEERLAAATEALRHVWGCPYEPFACSDPLHAQATALVADYDAAALAAACTSPAGEVFPERGSTGTDTPTPLVGFDAGIEVGGTTHKPPTPSAGEGR